MKTAPYKSEELRSFVPCTHVHTSARKSVRVKKTTIVRKKLTP